MIDLYDWLAGSLPILLNVKAGCSWPVRPSTRHHTKNYAADTPAFYQILSNKPQPVHQHVNSASLDINGPNAKSYQWSLGFCKEVIINDAEVEMSFLQKAAKGMTSGAAMNYLPRGASLHF